MFAQCSTLLLISYFLFLLFFFSFLTPPSLSLANLNQFLATSNISESVANEHERFFRTVAANGKFRINYSFDKNLFLCDI